MMGTSALRLRGAQLANGVLDERHCERQGVRLASLAADDTEREMTTDKESHIATAPGCGMHQDGGWNEFWD